MLWKPATSGVPALVTVIAMDLEKDRVQVHILRTSTQTCAAHWVDMSQLSQAPVGALPCACVAKAIHEDKGNDAA
jgi:hypothetical protein